MFKFLVLLFVSFVHGAINPNPRLRVATIRWGKTILVEEPASTAFSFLITIMCAVTLIEYINHHKKLRAVLISYPYHCKNEKKHRIIQN